MPRCDAIEGEIHLLARGSGPFVGISFTCFIVSVVLRAFISPIFLPVSILFLALLAFMLVFFRDPQRDITNGIAAPADGIVRKIDEREGMVRIETFMNVHNVHVNRAPLPGRVLKIERKAGGKSAAYLDESDKNEQVHYTIETEIGTIRVVQIVGVVARRIVPYIEEGQTISKGQRIGMIRFGSRVDLYLPRDRAKVEVTLNQRVFAGETRMASIVISK